MANSESTPILLSTLDYYKSEQIRRDSGYESANEKARKRLQLVKGINRLNVDETLKVLDAFYDNWLPLDNDKLEVSIKPKINIAKKPVFNEAVEERAQFAKPSSSSVFVEEPKEQMTPLMAFNAEFAGRPLSQIFKYAAELATKSGRLPSEEIARLAERYPEAVLNTFAFTPQQASDYNRINKRAIQMLCRDLSILLNAPPEPTNVPRKYASILKRNNNRLSTQPKNPDVNPKRVRISEPIQDESPLTQLYRDSNNNQLWPEKLDQQGLAKIMPELGEDDLPTTMIPYPPPAFFAFPMMP